MDVQLKTAAVLGWLLGSAAVLGEAVSPLGWLLLLGVGFYAAAAALTALIGTRSCARVTRRAVYHQRRWDDTPEAAVLQLFRADAHERHARGSVHR